MGAPLHAAMSRTTAKSQGSKCVAYADIPCQIATAGLSNESLWEAWGETQQHLGVCSHGTAMTFANDEVTGCVLHAARPSASPYVLAAASMGANEVMSCLQ